MYSNPIPEHSTIKGIEFGTIHSDKQRWLERPFKMEEVLAAVNNLLEDKEPSPESFLIRFLKVCWDIVGRDAFAALEAFLSKD